MSYIRVIPRDLFNEAKLLKCLGQLALLIHDGKGIRWPMRLEHAPARAGKKYEVEETPGFVIDQRPEDGGLYCSNLRLFVGRNVIPLYTTYNSKAPYPLLFGRPDYSEADVFNSDGTLSDEFAEFLDRVTAEKT